MYALLCSRKPNEEKAELYRNTFLALPWNGELVLMAAVAMICM